MAASAVTEPTRPLDRVPVEAILADARQAKPGRALLAIIGAVFIAIAWTAGKLWTVIFMTISYTLASMKYGWRASQGTLGRPSYDQLLAEVMDLRAQVGRPGPIMPNPLVAERMGRDSS